VAGGALPAALGERFEVTSPDDGRLLARVARGTAADIHRAVEAAWQAFPAWANLAPAIRERLLLNAADLLEKRADELLELLIDESGSTITKARYEVEYAPSLLRTAAGEVRRLYGDTFPNDRPDRLSMVFREPLGVVAVISPFNAPLALLVKMAAFPLAAGNTVVAKPSEETPLVALAFGRLLLEAGFPAGVFNVVTGYGGECGQALVTHAQVAAIAFTGSTGTGRRIGVQAIDHMKRMQLELGGKNPMIILRDFDPVEAAQATLAGSFAHAGQICMASSRILIEAPALQPYLDALLPRVERLFLGPLRDPRTVYGPLIHAAALQKVHGQVTQAVSEGAQVLTGGQPGEGLRYRPTVLLNPSQHSAVWQEETFGPVISLVPVADLEEAISLANASLYGLSAAILTRDIRQGFEAARRIRAGSVHIGTHPFQSNALAPIGGYGLSGVGKSGGKYSIEAFTELKWVSVELGAGSLPFSQ